MSNQKHTFHLVDPSPWPLMTSMGALILTNSFVMYVHFFNYGEYFFFGSLIFVILCMTFWWRDVISEATFEGHHTKVVKSGLKYGMVLFMVSEVMFFFAFFWGFFHSSLSPTVEMGSMWPPMGMTPFNPWGMPFLNTLMLLLSGATITWSHHALMSGFSTESINGLMATMMLAILFTGFQVYEYSEASFDMSDGIYGSTFYMATGFHGFHVIIGTLFLTVCLYSLYKFHFTPTHHFGFEAAAWYWHFVDVVWLFLFVSMYYWGAA